MNNKEAHDKVHTVMYALMKETNVVAPVEVLMAMGVLSKADYEKWRFGRVDYLERVCKINLRKLSFIAHEIRVFARKNNLKPSWTAYNKWGKGERIRLRFSKSRDERVEQLYATHYVSQRKVEEAAARKAARKQTDEKRTDGAE